MIDLQGYYFDSVVGYDNVTGLPTYDRAVDGAAQRQLCRAFYSNGVFPDLVRFQQANYPYFFVQANENENEVVINGGLSVIDGTPTVGAFMNEVITLSPPSSQPRYDLIALYRNTSNDGTETERSCKVIVIEGAPASNPVDPEFSQTFDGDYHLVVARIYRRPNVTVISNADIQDTRGIDDYCGWCVTQPNTLDTTSLFLQFEAWLQAIQEMWEEWWSGQEAPDGYLTREGVEPTLKDPTKTVINAINEDCWRTLGDYNVWCAPNGDDDSGDGTVGNPYRTLQKCYDSIPEYHFGNATLFVTAGFSTSTNTAGPLNINRSLNIQGLVVRADLSSISASSSPETADAYFRTGAINVGLRNIASAPLSYPVTFNCVSFVGVANEPYAFTIYNYASPVSFYQCNFRAQNTNDICLYLNYANRVFVVNCKTNVGTTLATAAFYCNNGSDCTFIQSNLVGSTYALRVNSGSFGRIASGNTIIGTTTQTNGGYIFSGSL